MYMVGCSYTPSKKPCQHRTGKKKYTATLKEKKELLKSAQKIKYLLFGC